MAGYTPSKSTTILNYCGINNKHIDFHMWYTKDKLGNILQKHIYQL